MKSLEGETGLKIFSVQDTTCHWLCMNGKKPPFDNVKVRLAVSRAIDRRALIQAVHQGSAFVGAALPGKPYGAAFRQEAAP